MPEALATTKRKFHKLLDSRFGSPAAAPAPRPLSQVTVTGDEPAPKRIRSGGSISRALVTALRDKNASTASIKPVKLLKEPNFAPWSHDAFVKRLQSFSPVTSWHPKPDAINEVEWSKRGWWCVDTNTVGCRGGCGQRVVVNADPIVKRHRTATTAGANEEDREDQHEDEDDQEELEQALVDRYKDLIVEGHSEDCLWRKAGCKADIYRLPIVKSAVWQPELGARYQSLLAISPSLANLNLLPNDLQPSPQKLLANFPPSLLSQQEDKPVDEPETTSEAKEKALTIAICGWRASTESSTQLLVCDACFQRIGLWMYQSDYKPAFADDDDDEPEDRTLDLLQLHRDHCPWRNHATQAASGNYAKWPAWKILLDVLDRYVDEHRRRSRGTMHGPVTAGTEVESEVGTVTEDGRDSIALASMPDLTREETNRLDKERTSKLRRLKTVLGFKKRPAPAS